MKTIELTDEEISKIEADDFLENPVLPTFTGCDRQLPVPTYRLMPVHKFFHLLEPSCGHTQNFNPVSNIVRKWDWF